MIIARFRYTSTQFQLIKYSSKKKRWGVQLQQIGFLEARPAKHTTVHRSKGLKEYPLSRVK
jgi:hypothetical protein